jgi:hypothetical protein
VIRFEVDEWGGNVSVKDEEEMVCRSQERSNRLKSVLVPGIEANDVVWTPEDGADTGRGSPDMGKRWW